MTFKLFFFLQTKKFINAGGNRTINKYHTTSFIMCSYRNKTPEWKHCGENFREQFK